MPPAPAPVPDVLALHVASTAAYAGFQVLVQVVLYRQFPLVPRAAFPAYLRAHQRRIVLVVGPLFAALVGTSAALLLLARAVPLPARMSACALTAGILALSGFAAVPAHRRLARGFDPATYRRLLLVDAARCVLALANAVTALVLSR